jgi:hypothetical protein
MNVGCHHADDTRPIPQNQQVLRLPEKGYRFGKMGFRHTEPGAGNHRATVI